MGTGYLSIQKHIVSNIVNLWDMYNVYFNILTYLKWYHLIEIQAFINYCMEIYKSPNLWQKPVEEVFIHSHPFNLKLEDFSSRDLVSNPWENLF